MEILFSERRALRSSIMHSLSSRCVNFVGTRFCMRPLCMGYANYLPLAATQSGCAEFCNDEDSKFPELLKRLDEFLVKPDSLLCWSTLFKLLSAHETSEIGPVTAVLGLDMVFPTAIGAFVHSD